MEENIREHLQLAEIAAMEGAALVLFPELSLTGYEVSGAHALAFSVDDARLNPLINFARERRITLVVGAPLSLHGRLYIAAIIVDPNERIAVYTKQRLGAFSSSASCDGIVPPPEATVFTAGNQDPEIRIGRTTARVGICADIGSPEHPTRAAATGAGVYLASMFVIPSEYEGDAARLGQYARDHRLLVGLANYGCPTGGLNAAGRSSLWDRSGELLLRLPSAGSGVGIFVDGAAKVRMLNSETAPDGEQAG